MLHFILNSATIMWSMIFLQTNHPLAMGLTLLIQTFLVCLITGFTTKTFWFSYILFLIFLGGMLVLFIYVTSLASNEMFTMSLKITLFSFSILLALVLTMFMMDHLLIMTPLKNTETLTSDNLNLYFNENTINLNKLYNSPTNLITLLLIIYLLITLVAIVKITNIFYGPLRTMN